MASAPRKMAGEGGLAGCLEALESQANGPLRHLTARELAVMASVSKGFHGGFDYSHMRGLVAGYISDVLEECELTSHSRTDHGEPWVSYYRVLAPLVGSARRRVAGLCGANAADGPVACCVYALLATQDLATYFRRGGHLTELNDGEGLGSGGKVARALAAVFAGRLGGESSSGDCSELCAALRGARPEALEAGDAGAAWEGLMDVLHHDLNLFRGRREELQWYYDNKKSDEINAIAAADVEASTDLSIVRDLFMGRLKRTQHPNDEPTAVCTKEFPRFYSLDLSSRSAEARKNKAENSSDGGLDLDACLAELFEEPEAAMVNYRGSDCGGVVATKLVVSPDYLVVRVPPAVARFPARNLDLDAFAMHTVRLEKHGAPHYDLYAAVFRAEDGAFYAAAMDAASNDWFEYDGSTVAAVKAPGHGACDRRAGAEAQLLFYKRRDIHLDRRLEGPPIRHLSFFVPKKKSDTQRQRDFKGKHEEQNHIFEDRMTKLKKEKSSPNIKDRSRSCALM